MKEQHLKTHEIQFDSLESKVKNRRGRQRTREFEEEAKGLKIRSSSSCRVESLRTGTQRSVSRRSTRKARTPSPMPRNFHVKHLGERSRSRFPGGIIPRAERFVEVEQTTPALGPQTYLTENSLDRLRQGGAGGVIPKAHRFNVNRVKKSAPGPQSYRAEDALDR